MGTVPVPCGFGSRCSWSVRLVKRAGYGDGSHHQNHNTYIGVATRGTNLNVNGGFGGATALRCSKNMGSTVWHERRSIAKAYSAKIDFGDIVTVTTDLSSTQGKYKGTISFAVNGMDCGVAVDYLECQPDMWFPFVGDAYPHCELRLVDL